MDTVLRTFEFFKNPENLMAVFTMVLIVSGNYLAELFPCKIRYLLSNSMILKHLFGFFTLIFMVTLTMPDLKKSNDMLLLSAGLYLVFVFLSKVHYMFWLAIVGSLMIFYLNQTFIDKLKGKEFDPIKKAFGITQDILKLVMIFLFIIGFSIYLNDKKLEYGKNFSYVTFLLGKTSCKNDAVKGFKI